MEYPTHTRHAHGSFETFSKLHADRAFLFTINDRRLELHRAAALPEACTFPPSVWGEPDTTPCDACIDDHTASLTRAYGTYLTTDSLPELAPDAPGSTA